MAKWPYNTTQWQRLRMAHLSMFPMCEECEAIGELQTAQAVDHRQPISDGGAPFPSHDGLASLCYRCHAAKTARGVEAGAIKTRKPRKGCSIDGQPLDRKHPWHAKGVHNKGSKIAHSSESGTDRGPQIIVSLEPERAENSHFQATESASPSAIPSETTVHNSGTDLDDRIDHLWV